MPPALRRGGISHLRGQVARHFHTHADLTNFRCRPCHGVAPSVVLRAPFWLEPRALTSYGLPRPPNNRRARRIQPDHRIARPGFAPSNRRAPYPRSRPACAGVTTFNALRHTGAGLGRHRRRSRGGRPRTSRDSVRGAPGLPHRRGQSRPRQGGACPQARRERLHRQRSGGPGQGADGDGRSEGDSSPSSPTARRCKRSPAAWGRMGS